jgi:2-dehydro-3-deoxyphosphogluconate aldolase / (4S)-4-hydroxy-2-oxoglutarate aldolase
MNRNEVRQRILDIGIVPVVRASSSRKAQAAAEAVHAGGISIVEVTMTVPGAIQVISELVKALGDECVIGAGTVLDAATAQQCIDVGAEFIVSPGFDADTVKLTKSAGKLALPGALTPTEVISAWKAGADFVKIFPCSAVGGANYLKALRGPLPQVPLVPTGGINLTNAAEFIRAGAAALGIGGELISAAALDSGNTAQITDLARKYVAAVREARNPEPVSVMAGNADKLDVNRAHSMRGGGKLAGQ